MVSHFDLAHLMPTNLYTLSQCFIQRKCVFYWKRPTDRQAFRSKAEITRITLSIVLEHFWLFLFVKYNEYEC